jgi:Cu2+-containing amine oxidase
MDGTINELFIATLIRNYKLEAVSRAGKQKIKHFQIIQPSVSIRVQSSFMISVATFVFKLKLNARDNYFFKKFEY